MLSVNTKHTLKHTFYVLFFSTWLIQQINNTRKICWSIIFMFLPCRGILTFNKISFDLTSGFKHWLITVYDTALQYDLMAYYSSNTPFIFHRISLKGLDMLTNQLVQGWVSGFLNCSLKVKRHCIALNT